MARMTKTEQTIAEVRPYLRKLANRRSSKTFTSDDIHAFLNKRNFRGNRLSVISTVLQDSLFYNTGNQVPSDRPVARSRKIYEYSVN